MAQEVIQKWTFGEPTLLAVGSSDAVWSRGAVSPYFQKSPTGWLANLYGGDQSIGSDDNFAAVDIPVDELHPIRFLTALWSYYFTNAEVYGVNMVIWMHDPTDNDKRVEITQAPSGATLEKGSGWNAHELNTATTQFFYYGEGVSGSGLNAGTQYKWTQFQTDAVFSKWTIYKISFEYGWYSTGVFDDAWVADIKLNGQVILLKPDSSGTGRIGHRHATNTSGAIAHALAPKTPFRLLNFNIEISSAGTTDESLTITKDSGNSAAYDVKILDQNTKTPAITSLHQLFGEGYEYEAWDEIDTAWPNTENRTYGLTWTYQTVF